METNTTTTSPNALFINDSRGVPCGTLLTFWNGETVFLLPGDKLPNTLGHCDWRTISADAERFVFDHTGVRGGNAWRKLPIAAHMAWARKVKEAVRATAKA